MRKILTSLALAAAFLTGGANAQTYPNQSIKLVVPFAAGGPTDIIARIMGEHMSHTLGQAIIVDNVVGAGGTTGSDRVAKSAPDGYTIIMGNLGTHSASVGLYPKLTYDPRTDFEPIINTAGTPMLISGHKEFAPNTLAELIALAKANPNKLNYGHGGVGSTSHLTCIFFHYLAKVEAQHVPFRGSGPAMQALLGKQIDYVCDQTVGIVPQLPNLKTYVVATPARISTAPNVPTSNEAGLGEFQAVGWNALFAPKGTPKDIITRLNAAARAALADESVRKRLADLGCIIGSDAELTPEYLGNHVKKEVDKWSVVIKAVGVTAN